MKTFNDLQFKPHPAHNEQFDMGIIARETFDNGWGVSVVRSPYTFGGKDGLYELAVFKDNEIHYDNDIAKGDVVGYLREEDVTDAMLVIQTKFK